MEYKEEVKEFTKKLYKGYLIKYEEVFYMDYEVNEKTGKINKNKLVKTYTKDQMVRNLKKLKENFLLKIDCNLFENLNSIKPTQEDLVKIFTNQFSRASGDAICNICFKTYNRHPTLLGCSWLNKICDNNLVKL